jgi:hypothetical protein
VFARHGQSFQAFCPGQHFSFFLRI